MIHKTLTMEQAKVEKGTLKRGRHSFCLSFPEKRVRAATTEQQISRIDDHLASHV
jgi:hypothetical protein